MVAETPEEELARLIKEQEQDMKDGSFQRPEPVVTPFSSMPSSWSMGDEARTQRGYWYCNIHGTADMRTAPPSWQARGIQFRCYECKRETDRRVRQLHRRKSDK